MGVMLRGTDRRANRKVAIGIGSKCQAWKNENEFANKQKRTILFLLPATALKMDKNPPSPHTYPHVRPNKKRPTVIPIELFVPPPCILQATILPLLLPVTSFTDNDRATDTGLTQAIFSICNNCLRSQKRTNGNLFAIPWRAAKTFGN